MMYSWKYELIKGFHLLYDQYLCINASITIKVYGFQNSTYSMIVSTNQGFTTPIALLDEQMQSGAKTNIDRYLI